jgi:hypothetical protein
VNEGEVGGAFGMHGRGEKSVQGFGGSLKERNHWKDEGVDGKIGIRIDLEDIGWGCGVDSIGSG